MTALLELAAKAESAEGPDRELDALIGATLIGATLRIGPGNCPEWARKNFPEWGAHPTLIGHTTVLHDNGAPGLHWQAKPYTASLDAAITLVPDGHHWQVGIGIETEFGKRDKSYAWCSEADEGELSIAATPALALCAAALRARGTA